MIDDAPTGIPEPIWRAAMDAANNVAWPYEDTPAPMIDDEYDLAKCVRAAVEHLIEHLNTTAPSITPDQMQDGKRYRLIFEGEFRRYPTADIEGNNGELIEFDPAEGETVVACAYDLSNATRIEELQ